VLHPLLLLAGVVAASAKLQRAPALENARFAVPAELIFPGYARAWEVGILLLTLALMTITYAAIVRDAAAIPRPMLLASAACAALFALIWPVVYSPDIWAYAAYGEQVLRHIDPYGSPIVSSVRAPGLVGPLRAWSGSIPRDVYGPLFTLFCAAAAATRQPLLVLRILFVLALLVCVRFWPTYDRRGAALFGAHPVVLWSVAEGHNDILAFAFIVLAWRTGPAAGLALRVVAAATKAYAIVPLAIELSHRHRLRKRGFALAGVFLAVCYLPVLVALPAFFAHGGAREQRFSAIGIAISASAPVGLRALAIALVVGLLAMCFVRRRDGWAVRALAAWAVFPTIYPWYAVWLVAIVARTLPSPAWAALLGASFATLATYLPQVRYGAHIPTAALLDTGFIGGLLLLQYAVPLLVLGTAQTYKTFRDRSIDRPPFPSLPGRLEAT
jgi:hypothetical protein